MMFTGPRAMNTYPYQTNHTPSTHYYHPNWEPSPMHAKENPVGPIMREPWPRYYGCQAPMPCPNCSNHGHYPSPCYISPHCQQFPSPPPHYYGGCYPPYPQPCYVGFVPPPHYSMELPRYEYDKNVQNGFHCCGCPNHQCNMKEVKGVKIEEHEPDVETKKSESLVPSGGNSFPYPILWIPSEYGANKNFRSADKEVDDGHGKQVLPYVSRPQRVDGKKQQEFPTVLQHQKDSQPAEQDSTRYGWFPLDMDGLKKLIESGVREKPHSEEWRNEDERSRNDVGNKNQNKQFPYNIIWLPYDGQGKKEEQTASTDPVEKGPAISGAVPSKSDHPMEKLQECVSKPSVESKEQKEANKSGGNVKIIPVKQVEEFVPKLTVESKEIRGDKEAKGKADEKRAENGDQSLSPTKKSKLPPICLRVDPPKKRNGGGNGSLRFPSPPGDKKRQSPDDLKTSGKTEAVQHSKKDIKVEAKDDKLGHKKIDMPRVPQNEKKESVSEKSADSKEKAVNYSNGENSGATVEDGREVHTENRQGGAGNKGQETRKPTKRSISETEAAVIIQSTYRGHEVRRTEPLKKLRQIVKVRDEVDGVRKRIEDLVSSGGSITDKEKVAIGETIMKLLLKLDTIQGLLPSIRDVRKCVAKELIVLQEKLDSIACQNAAPQEPPTVEEQAKHSCMDEDRKDDIETRNESPSADSSGVPVSEVNSESANEFLKDTIQGDGSECAGIAAESSKDSAQDENSRISEQVSILNEGSHEMDMNVNENEGELAHGTDQVVSCQPPVTEDHVYDSEIKENLEASPVSVGPANVDSESGPQDEVTVSPAGGSSELGAVENDLNASEQHPVELSEESEESPAGLEYAAELNEEEAENLLAELPRNVLDYDEMNEETPDMEADMESTLRELPIQVIDDDNESNRETPKMVNIETKDEEQRETDAGSAISAEAASDDPTLEDKDVDVDILSELPHELPELVPEEQDVVVPSSEVLKDGTKVEQSSENHEPEPDLQPTESQARVDHVPQSGESSVDTDVPIAEPGDNEGVVPRNEGLSMSNIASGLNANDQLASAEAVKQESFDKHSDFEAQQTKDEDATSELSSESQDSVGGTKNEEIDRKLIEENERMKEMLEKMIAYGKQQQDLISSLSSKVGDLEKRLVRKKAAKEGKRPRVKVLRSKCGKSGNGLLKERAMGVAS